MNKDDRLKIIVTHNNSDYSDNLDIELSASANLALGFIQRARFELDKMEKQVFADLSKNSKEVKK